MSLEHGFDDRMQVGRAIAQERRNRGLPTGAPAKGWNAKRPQLEDTTENRLHAELADVRRELREAQTEIARHSMGSADDLADFGAEFDRLVGRGLPASPLSPRSSTTPARTRGAATMKTEHTTEKDSAAREAALKMLADGTASPSEVAELAGVSRQLVRHWMQATGVNWRKARETALAKAWRKALRA